MRHLGMWLMALGLMAVSAVDSCGAWGNSTSREQATKQRNQETANGIAKSLRAAKLQGYDIGIEVKEGTAILTGEVIDAAQKQKAATVAQKVRGVKKVDNRMIVSPPIAVANKSPVVPTQTKTAPISRNIELTSAAESATNEAAGVSEAPPDNQQIADQIAASLGRAGLSGYDLEVRFQEGQAAIAGAVANPAQRAKITQVVSRIPGVESVDNSTIVSPQAGRRPGPNPYAGPMRAPIRQVNFSQDGGPMAGNIPMPGIPMPGMPSPVARSTAGQVYDSPNLPDHAWPSYAQYPNSAAVTYPKEYSASAWPYIGPFYPYPQVPLGWRAAQLEWDDGHWNLNFRSRTDKWWWFMQPSNW